MFFPLKDENPAVRTPYVTFALIGLCTLVYLWEFLSGPGMGRIVYEYGLIPAHFFGTALPVPGADPAAPVVTVFTSMFLHGSWMHLIGNMWFLWIFGNNIEDEFGHTRFVIFYILCGVAAAFLQMFLTPNSEIPMVGASGAVSGVLGAYLLLHPRVRILTLIFLGFFVLMRPITAAWFLGIWFGYQALFAFLDAGGVGGGTAWWAHVGGFVAGVGLLFLFRPSRPQALARDSWDKPRFKPPRQEQKPPERDDTHRGPWG